MAIAFRSAAQTLNASSSSTGTLALPSGYQTNDLVLFFATDNEGSATTVSSGPSGWTQIGSKQDGSGTSMGAVLYYKVMTSSESTPVITWSSSAAQRGIIMLAFSGVSTSTPISNSSQQTNASSSNITVPALTSSTHSELAIFGNTDATTSYTTPSGWSADANAVHARAVAYYKADSSSNPGSVTIALGGSTASDAFQVGLIAASGSSPITRSYGMIIG